MEVAPPEPVMEPPVMQEPPLVQPAEPAAPLVQEPAAPAAPVTAAISKPMSDDPEHAKAQRLARTIISDIALYNEEAVKEGIQNGNLRDAVEPFLDEGREHYREKVSDAIQSSTNYFDEALDAWIARKTGAARV